MEITSTYKRVIEVAAPIIMGSYAEQIINVTDTIFVTRLGDVALDAVGLGGLYYFTFVFIAAGLAMGMQILTGRRNGEKDYRQIGCLLDNSIGLFAVIAIVLYAFLYLCTPYLLGRLIDDKATYDMAMQYLGIRMGGIFFICFTYVFRSFYIGITHTRVIIIITVIVTLINIIFNKLLIFGLYGFPQMGIRGSATASVIAEGTGCMGYFIYTLLRKENRKYHAFRFSRWRTDLMGGVLSTGFPVMLQMWTSIASWFVFFTLIEKEGGQLALSVSTLIKSIYLFGMIPVWGLAQATNTLVSNAMGAERQGEVKVIIRRVVTVSFVLITLMMQANLLFPEQVMRIYTDKQYLIAPAIAPLRIIAIATIIMSIGSVYFNAVSGTGATRITLAIELGTLVLYAAYVWITTHMREVRLELVWGSEVLYMSIIALGSFAYMASGRWKKIKL